ERLAVGEERDLLDLAAVAMDLAADRVANLVGGDDRPIALVHRAAPSGAYGDLEPSCVHVLVADRGALAPRGHDRCLVEQIGELGATEAARLTRDLLE